MHIKDSSKNVSFQECSYKNQRKEFKEERDQHGVRQRLGKAYGRRMENIQEAEEKRKKAGLNIS